MTQQEFKRRVLYHVEVMHLHGVVEMKQGVAAVHNPAHAVVFWLKGDSILVNRPIAGTYTLRVER